MTRTCVDCGCEFPGEHWMSRCGGCWRVWRDERDRHEQREIHARREADRAGYERGYHRGFAEGRKRSGVAIERSLIDACVHLAHPDRHPVERRELATRTTQTLLDLREELAFREEVAAA